MILKTLSRRSNGTQLLRYVMRYVLEKDTKETKKETAHTARVIHTHNLRSKSLEGYIKEFKHNETYRLVKRHDNTLLHHTILAFSNRDTEKITDKVLRTTAKKFVELRGNNCLHLAVQHSDTKHRHLHIITSGVAINGKSSRISKDKLKSIKRSLDEFQKEHYPFLVNSLPAHGKKQELSTEKKIASFKASRETNKADMLNTLENIYQASISQADFLGRLKTHGYEPYERGATLTGIKSENSKYRFSTVGFDTKRLHLLDEKNNQLKHLSDVRDTKEKGMSKSDRLNTFKKDVAETEKETESKELQELSDLRENSKERQQEKEDEKNNSKSSFAIQEDEQEAER